jgi:hypothetical protein
MDEPLNKLIGVRVSTPFYDKLSGLMKQTNCQTIGEFARMILQKEEIIFYHKDASMDSVAAELAGIKKELRAIGVNINQAMRYFHGTNSPEIKLFESKKMLDDYYAISSKVDNLFTIISDLSTKWSPK